MSHRLSIVGLGPAGLERLPAGVIGMVTDPEVTVVVRTMQHPASAELAAIRTVQPCDDLYQELDDFDAVYAAIVDRVLTAVRNGPTVYAVPGSAVVGERSVAAVRAAAESGLPIDVYPGESFLALVWDRTGVDPILHGGQVLDGRDLPDPLPLHVPTVITQIDTPLVLAEVAATLGRVLDDAAPVVFLDALGGDGERVIRCELKELHSMNPGPRSSLLVDAGPVGWHGLVTTNRVLRQECPWDREQTHHSLVSHLIEEAYETVEAVGRLHPDAPSGEPDFGAYAEVEEELGDLLLQVVFHATLAEEAGAFDVESVAERIRRKLVHRHPHVFGDVEAETAEQVKVNWENIKAAEKERSSLMDDVPVALPAMARADKMQRRAASVGFDWRRPDPVIAKVHEELEELTAELVRPSGGDSAAVRSELGDVLFSLVNLARHLGVDPELALRDSADAFARRFRLVERLAAVSGRELSQMTLSEIDELWETAKRSTSGEHSDSGG